MQYINNDPPQMLSVTYGLDNTLTWPYRLFCSVCDSLVTEAVSLQEDCNICAQCLSQAVKLMEQK